VAALVFGLLAVVAMFGLGAAAGDLHRGIYLLLFSLVVGIAACVIGITALVKAHKTETYRPRGAIGGVVLGALAALLSASFVVMYLIYPSQLSTYFRCLSQAQSSQAQQACSRQFYKSTGLGA
jgi:hypothetical protein